MSLPPTEPALVVNGRPLPWSRGMTIASLVASMRLTGKRIAVERNGEIVPKSRYGETSVEAGDRIEIVGAVGGG